MKRTSSNYDVSNSQYFDKLAKEIQDEAYRLAEKRAYKMTNILYHRWILGTSANGKYPRQTPISNKSYAHWSVVPKGSGVYQIKNDATSPTNNFNYPYVLSWGTTNPSPIWVNASKNSKKIVVGRGGKYFSSQMERGLYPWLQLNWEQLKDEISNIRIP